MKTVIEDIKNNWTLIAFMCAMVIWYANTNSRLKAIEEVNAEQESTLEIISNMKTDIAVMKTDISYIKEKVE